MNIVGSRANYYIAVDRRGRIVVAGTAYDDEFEIREDHGQPDPAIARLRG